MSIRTRLTLAVAAVIVATFAILGVALVRSTRATLIDQVDAEVRANAARVNRAGPPPDRIGGDDNGLPASGDGAAPPAATTTAATDAFDAPVARFRYDAQGVRHFSQPSGFQDAPQSEPKIPAIPSPALDRILDKIVTTPAVDGSLSYRMLVERTDYGEYWVTAGPLDDVAAAIDRLVRILVVVGGVGLAAAVGVSWWIIQRGLRPVDRMVDTAAAIAAGDLSRRVPDADARSELGRLGGALNEMLGQIEGALDARSASEARLRRFVADAAHELRTPLTSLRGYAELYRQGAIPDEAGVANAMGRIESEGSRMARLVDDLLLLARVDQQRGLELKPLDLAALAEEAAADFRVVAPDHPLTTDLPGPVTVPGDRVRLRQIIDNLLTNARLHTPAGTAVKVAVSVAGNQAELTVADNGPGITPEDQTRVFERFWRADPARARRTGGSGLGLAIVQGLVAAHGGGVTLESAPGAGATFRVRLPLAGQPAPSPKPQGAAVR